ncbi:MAG TPA: hypothetical protein VHP36_05795 [Chitinispirillaceae bacterium]|nr:hypothetical protein [Chitinispirillaceae bacterium]
MKRSFALLFCIIFSSSIYAQNWASSEASCYAKGNFNISAGLGIGWLGFFVIGEYGINDAISASIATGYQGYGYSTWWRYNYVPIVARAAFHPFNLKALSNKIPIRNKLDPYAGLAMGWHIGWATELEEIKELNDTWFGDAIDNSKPKVGHFTFRELIGVKFYPTEKFFLTAEEGGGLSWINLGVGFKF